MSNENQPLAAVSNVIPAPGLNKIELNDAIDMTNAYRNALPEGVEPGICREGGTFNRDVFDAILAHPACCGIRYYFAIDTAGEPSNKVDEMTKAKNLTIVVVGVDKDGNDILNSGNVSISAGATSDTLIAERSYPYPQHKGTAKMLNNDPE